MECRNIGMEKAFTLPSSIVMVLTVSARVYVTASFVVALRSLGAGLYWINVSKQVFKTA